VTAPNWGELFCAIAERFGWTFDEVQRLTIPQLRAVIRYLNQHPVRPVRLVEVE
jgi:hypothetical protein